MVLRLKLPRLVLHCAPVVGQRTQVMRSVLQPVVSNENFHWTEHRCTAPQVGLAQRNPTFRNKSRGFPLRRIRPAHLKLPRSVLARCATDPIASDPVRFTALADASSSCHPSDSRGSLTESASRCEACGFRACLCARESRAGWRAAHPPRNARRRTFVFGQGRMDSRMDSRLAGMTLLARLRLGPTRDVVPFLGARASCPQRAEGPRLFKRAMSILLSATGR